MKDALGSVQSVLVLGGGSDIALATMRELVQHRATTIVLAARHPEALETTVKELHEAAATGSGGMPVTVEAVAFDALATETHETFVEDVFDRFGDFDLVLVAFGVYGNQETADRDHRLALDMARTNYLGAVSVAPPLADRLRTQGHGTIVLLSSVAGERARKSNYTYGATKAGVDAFFQGLGDSLAGTGVSVMIVRPGFVHTKMTQGLTPAPLSTTPEAVAEAIVDGLARGDEVVWVPRVLRWVMAALRHLPRALFRRLPL
jgi:decaprenylphospho-beta-D-erythro-pentofuranosid-2-ulose 2-reductase